MSSQGPAIRTAPATPIRAQPEILLTGTFDVRNYGDLIFPLIAEAELGRHGMKLRLASPTSQDTGWMDCLQPEPLGDLLDGRMTYDGLLIGGGNIIHDRAVNLPDYVDAGVECWAYPGLWLGATFAAAKAGKPVVWNAPGVPWPLHDSLNAPLIRSALSLAAHVTVRDEESATHLGWESAQVVTDTVLGIASLWNRDGLNLQFQTLLLRHGADPASRYIAIHLKRRSLDATVEDLAQQLDAFRDETGLIPILIGIGHCHGDQVVTTALAEAMKGPRIDLSNPLGLREIAAAIAYAEGYVGASMHGYITAAAYGIPGVIVGRPCLPKMAGLLRHLNRPGDDLPNWSAALAAIRPRLGESCPLPATIRPALDAHWSRVTRHFQAPSAGLAAFTRTFRHENTDPGSMSHPRPSG